MSVSMLVTPAQGLALQAMFDYWNQLSSQGSSRKVAFFVDGDGNFHPKCIVRFQGEEMPELTDELRKLAVIEEYNGDRFYDFDPIGWKINHPNQLAEPVQPVNLQPDWVDPAANKYAIDLQKNPLNESIDESTGLFEQYRKDD